MHSSVIALLAASPALIAASPSSLSSRAAVPAAYVTTSDLTHKLSPAAAPVSGRGTGGASTWDLTVDDTASGNKQKIIGFGASVTDATVTVMNALPADKRRKLIRELLTQDGADFGFLRHTIASSDLSGPPAYTYDDASNKADPSLQNFNLGDRGTAMAKMLAAFRGVKSGLTILGSPWSAPGWMKLNRVLTGNANNNQLDPQYYSSYAQYFVKYLQAYKANGATIDAITLQNEPLNNQGNGHVTMYQSADEAAKVTQQYVGPALKNAGFGSTRIWAYDHNTDQADYPRTVINAANSYVDSAAWHCYNGPNWGVLTDFHNAYPGKHQYMTECWTSSSTPWYQSSQNTIGPLQNWAEGTLMWTLGTWTQAADGTFGPYIPGGCDTCRGLFTVDKNAGTYSYTIDYYTLAQFSKFMPKGATVLAGTGSYSYDNYQGIQSVASRNPDGTKTVVIENTFGNDVYVTVTMKGGKVWSGNALRQSVTTWVLPA
ncbi:glycoside hydrolase family 30 protein [Astrocystis sublimbata]|nr:glycoside hydrolase family 30 protein [Astrocystis sublimbata]